MSARVGAYVCPRGVSGIVYRVARSGIEIVRSFDFPARIESERQAMEHLLRSLADANVKRAEIVLTLRGFGTVHHVLPMPPARDELLTPIVEREMKRLEPGLDSPTISWLPLPGDAPEVSDGPAQRQVLAGAAPRHVVDAIEAAIQRAGHRLTHLTILPAAAQRLYEEFGDSGEPTALVAPLRDGAFVGFFLSGALRLAVEPPLAPDELQDATALAEETELGAMFVRQQFRGAQVSRVILAAPSSEFTEADAAFTQRLGVPTARIAVKDLSSGGLVAFGGVLDARAASPLGLGTGQGRRGPSAADAIRVVANATLLIAAALAAFVAFTSYRARDAAVDLRVARTRVEQESFGMMSVRETAAQRKLISDAVGMLQLVGQERLAMRNALASIGGAAVAPVRLDSIGLTPGTDGWTAAVLGSIRGQSSARALELLHEFYRDLPTRLVLDALQLERLDYGDADPGDTDSRNVRFRVSFVVPYPKGT